MCALACVCVCIPTLEEQTDDISQSSSAVWRTERGSKFNILNDKELLLFSGCISKITQDLQDPAGSPAGCSRMGPRTGIMLLAG